MSLISVQEPVQVELGSQHVMEGTGDRRRTVQEKDTFTYVPILTTIESMLQNDAVLEEVRSFHISHVHVIVSTA